MAFDPTKPVRTRDGKEAAIKTINIPADDETILAVVIDDDGKRRARLYYNNGTCYGDSAHESRFDLVNIPERRSLWANVYTEGRVGGTCATLDQSIDLGPRAIYRLELVYEDDKLIEVIKHDVSNG